MKISALTAATTPLSGAELFPIVQSGNTRRVSLNDLLRSIGNGTAAAPALAPGGDPNTGIYFPAADTIGFVEGGVEVWRMSSSGHFLAGTDNSFDIGASGANRPRDLFVGRNATVAGNLTVDTNTLFVNAGNNRVGIGTTSPIVPLHVAGQVHIQPSTADNALLTFRHGSLSNSNYIEGKLNSSTVFGTANADRMTLDASGNLGLGVTPSAWANTGNVQIQGARGIAFGGNAYFYANAFSASTGNAYLTSSVAALYAMEGGAHKWFNAPSGTAGATISFTQAMTLDTNGYLGIGNTAMAAMNAANGAGNLVVGTGSGLEGITVYSGATNYGVLYFADSTTGTSTYAGGVEYSHSIDSLGFVVNTATRWRIDASGHLLAGADNVYDIGASGATRPRDLFLGRNMVGGGWVRAGAASAGAASTTTIGGTTATTVGAAGAASALPANPLGYIVAHVGTTEVRIPYYNA